MADAVKPLIALMIVLLVAAAAVVPIVVNLASQATEAQTASSESVTCTNGTTQTLDYDDLVTGTFTLTNGTVTIGSGNYTLSTSAGTVEFTTLNNTIYGTSCSATYNYYADAYMTNSTNRTLIDLLPLLVAIGMLLLVTGYFKMS
jgi:hypothetical protein